MFHSYTQPPVDYEFSQALLYNVTGNSPACNRTDSNSAAIHDFYSGAAGDDGYSVAPEPFFFFCAGPNAPCGQPAYMPGPNLTINVAVDTSLGLRCPRYSYIFSPIAQQSGIDPAVVAAIEANETGHPPAVRGGQPILDGYNAGPSPTNGGYGPLQYTPEQAHYANGCGSADPGLGDEHHSIACALSVLAFAYSLFPAGPDQLSNALAFYNGGYLAIKDHGRLSKTDWPDASLDYVQSVMRYQGYGLPPVWWTLS